MKLKEKLKSQVEIPLNLKELQRLEIVADDYAIEFEEWCRTIISRTGLLEYKLKWINLTSKELLEIFKKEKGY